MNELYEYRRIVTRPRSWPRLLRQIGERARPALEQEGGALFGVFLPQIGLPAAEGIVITTWPDAASLERGAGPALDALDDVRASEAERLAATVRPESPLPPAPGGVYAHRFFDIAESDWPEFLSLSEQAWVGFEKRFDARIVGFFRSLDAAPPAARVLLLTRYASLAVWEASRMAGARDEEAGHVRGLFQRRHALTEATIVRTTTLAALEAPG